MKEIKENKLSKTNSKERINYDVKGSNSFKIFPNHMDLHFNPWAFIAAYFLGVPKALADEMSYSQFLQAVKNHEIFSVVIDPEQRLARYLLNNKTSGTIRIAGE